jgi:peptidoglycan hydrolase-like protein with peptidoglycan-binding domain
LKTCDAKAPLLKKGDTGNAVKNAQALLISKGYACGGRIVQGSEVPDGDFGPTTEKSVKSYQSLKKLDTDGIIGSDTWTALLTT